MTERESTDTATQQTEERSDERARSEGGGAETISVPAGLAVDAFDGVEYAERSYVHDDPEYCARDTDGRVVVGVTNDDDEVLLLVEEEREHAVLPNGHVEDGDWAGVARRTVEEATGVAIDLGDVELVRAVDHRIEGDDGHRERTYHVIFGASPANDGEDRDPTCDDPDWQAGWYAEVPVDVDDEHGDVLADMERFLA